MSLAQLQTHMEFMISIHGVRNIHQRTGNVLADDVYFTVTNIWVSHSRLNILMWNFLKWFLMSWNLLQTHLQFLISISGVRTVLQSQGNVPVRWSFYHSDKMLNISELDEHLDTQYFLKWFLISLIILQTHLGFSDLQSYSQEHPPTSRICSWHITSISQWQTVEYLRAG